MSSAKAKVKSILISQPQPTGKCPYAAIQKKYKIKSTPTIVVNEKEYTGKVDYEKFKKIIEKNL